MLHVETLSSGHGSSTVLHEIDLHLTHGAVHAVVGHNGAGKSTLINTVAGVTPVASGRIHLDGHDLTRISAHRRARAGVAVVPQGRRLFASLTVAEHLSIAYRRRRARESADLWTPRRVLDLLPHLTARLHHRGGQLSGGEQQMVALARALLRQPRLLLLDEPTEGLAPNLAGEIRGLINQLRGGGLTILLTAPQPDLALDVAGHITVLTAGRATGTWRTETLYEDPAPLLAALTPAGRQSRPPAAPPGRRRAGPPAWATTLPPSTSPPGDSRT